MARRKKPVEDWTGQIYFEQVAPKAKRVPPEKVVLDQIRLAVATAGGVHVMRNNVGAFKLSGGRFFRAGLEKGSSDLVAIVAPYGRWLCLEVKRPKGSRFEDGQREWLAKMARYGAVVGAVSTVEEALALVARARRPAFEDEVA